MNSNGYTALTFTFKWQHASIFYSVPQLRLGPFLFNACMYLSAGCLEVQHHLKEVCSIDLSLVGFISFWLCYKTLDECKWLSCSDIHIQRASTFIQYGASNVAIFSSMLTCFKFMNTVTSLIQNFGKQVTRMSLSFLLNGSLPATEKM